MGHPTLNYLPSSKVNYYFLTIIQFHGHYSRDLGTNRDFSRAFIRVTIAALRARTPSRQRPAPCLAVRALHRYTLYWQICKKHFYLHKIILWPDTILKHPAVPCYNPLGLTWIEQEKAKLQPKLMVYRVVLSFKLHSSCSYPFLSGNQIQEKSFWVTSHSTTIYKCYQAVICGVFATHILLKNLICLVCRSAVVISNLLRPGQVIYNCS